MKGGVGHYPSLGTAVRLFHGRHRDAFGLARWDDGAQPGRGARGTPGRHVPTGSNHKRHHNHEQQSIPKGAGAIGLGTPTRWASTPSHDHHLSDRQARFSFRSYADSLVGGSGGGTARQGRDGGRDHPESHAARRDDMRHLSASRSLLDEPDHQTQLRHAPGFPSPRAQTGCGGVQEAWRGPVQTHWVVDVSRLRRWTDMSWKAWPRPSNWLLQ
jgi:hypothetical protein